MSMDIYTYTDKDGDKLTVNGNGPLGFISIRIVQDSDGMAAYIAKTDAPAVAAELLKAAGHDNLADLVGWDSAERKLQERREALASELSMGAYDYERLYPMLQNAIDRIIELEDGK